jgi:hypothetical protein
MLSLSPGLDVRVVHLVRDARAVANSWLRWKPAPDRIKPFVDRRTPARSSINLLVRDGYLGARSASPHEGRR